MVWWCVYVCGMYLICMRGMGGDNFRQLKLQVIGKPGVILCVSVCVCIDMCHS